MRLLAKKKVVDGVEYTQTIEEHGKHSLDVYNRLDEIYKLDEKFKSIIRQCNKKELSEDIVETILGFIRDAIYLHDMGKVNKEFQNKINGLEVRGDSGHSILSAYLYLVSKIEQIDKEYSNRKINRILKQYVVHISYLISKHHVGLDDFNDDEYFARLGNYIEYKDLNFDQGLLCGCREGEGFNANIYILDKLIYSILTTCDVVASYEFETGNEFEFSALNTGKINEYNNIFENNNTIKSIREGKADSEINKVRSEIYLKTEERITDCNISFIDAQTGSGKTITSLGASNKLMSTGKYKRLIYTAPFKSIIFQTEDTVRDVFGDNYMVKNEDTEIFVEYNDDEEDINKNYDKAVLDDTLLNKNIVITSHIKLFDILFGYKKASVMGLYGLIDSIIILDEIQSYRNKKWIQIINLLAQYSELLNIKFIIMSATLPKLDKLLDKDVECEYILKQNEVDKYRNFFNKRVKTDFSLLSIEDSDNKLDLVYDGIDKKIAQHKDKKKFLVGLITNKSTYMFYERFRQVYVDYDVLLLNGDTPRGTRQRIIDRINDEKNNKKVILIANQAIEAGVDISMDVGFKDYGILDSDIQFKGRIARNFEDVGVLYVFDYDDYKKIYKEDLRKKYTLADEYGQKMFVEEDFEEVYNANFDLLEKRSKLDKINKYCKGIKFESVNKEMQLIEQKYGLILINTPEAQKLHDELKELSYIESFSEKKIKKRKKRIEMKDYILKYNLYGNMDIPLYKDESTGFYILNDYEDYIEHTEFGNVFYMNRLREDLGCTTSELNLFI